MSQEGIVDVLGTFPQIPTSFIANIGTAVPIANTLEVLGTTQAAGTTPLHTTGSGNTLTIIAQLAQANAVSSTSIAGLASFNSADFTVDANGYVTLVGSSGITWHVVSTNQTGSTDSGYVFVSPGGALTISLPAVSAVGDQFIVTLDGATSWHITQGAGQQIRLGNTATTAGVGGSITSTQQGDSLTMVCSVANLKWNVLSSMGNPTVV